VGRAVSPVLPVHSPEERSGVRPRWRPYNFTNHEPTTGCHVAAHDWATWHLSNQSKTATCRALIRPCACHVLCHLSPYLPSQPADVIPATSACATCHPYSGDTCHPLTGPTVPVVLPHHLPCVITRSCHVICTVVRPVQSACHVALYGLYSHPLFFCLFGFSDRMRYLSHTKPV
jgi:hypothetical protein